MWVRIMAVLIALTLTTMAAGPARAQPAAIAGAVRPSFADLAYAPAEPARSKGHLLDLYLPPAFSGPPPPLVVWTGGSAWMADTGKDSARLVAKELNAAGFAVAGVSIRSSAQARYPAQLYDIKAAIRWLRANARVYGYDPRRIAIMGDSSGGWTAAMAAVTGDVPALEGRLGVVGPSSAVQAAIAFYPPTAFLQMDNWAVAPCAMLTTGAKAAICHDAKASPEARLLGCPIQSCPAKARAADPALYVSRADPPIMILHGGSDPLVPHNQGERLYQVLNKQCHDAVFISLPRAQHGPVQAFLQSDAARAGATRRSTSAPGCTIRNPELYVPTWGTIIDFLRASLR